MRCSRPLQFLLDHPRVDHSGAAFLVDDVDVVQVFGDIYHEAFPDSVARTGGPRATHRDRQAAGQGSTHHRDQLIAVLGVCHHQGWHPVQGGVGGIDGAGERRIIQ